jgi:hypothetical protein
MLMATSPVILMNRIARWPALRERPGAFQFMAYVGKKKSGRKLDGS